MPRRDIFHNAVKRALEKDGWTITHDPLILEIGEKILSIDLGAENLISAKKGAKKIAVEIKSFLGQSDVRDLQRAVGQYLMYLKIMERSKIERLLYLAVPVIIFETVFNVEIGKIFLEDHFLRLIVFDDKKEEIIKWIPG